MIMLLVIFVILGVFAMAEEGEMRDRIESLLASFGFYLIVGIFFAGLLALVGCSNQSSEVGRYQVQPQPDGHLLYMVDTKTGAIWWKRAEYMDPPDSWVCGLPYEYTEGIPREFNLTCPPLPLPLVTKKEAVK